MQEALGADVTDFVNWSAQPSLHDLAMLQGLLFSGVFPPTVQTSARRADALGGMSHGAGLRTHISLGCLRRITNARQAKRRINGC